MNYQVVGRSTGRKDEPTKVTGEAEYAVGVALPGMLFGKSVRSPHPSARIVRIDTPKAESVPGVRAVLTGADYEENLFMPSVKVTAENADDPSVAPEW
mgnify:CR=1 FL=1